MTKRPPPGATPGDVKLFIDRDLWSRALDTALREAGIPFVAHRDLFDDDVPDAEWLARIAPGAWWSSRGISASATARTRWARCGEGACIYSR